MTTKYQSDGEATRAIKGALRKAFPTAKISTTHGGSRIEWTDDGPTVEQVQDTIIAANCAEFERQRRPSWEPQLIIEDELLASCIELGLLKPDDKPIAIQARLKPAPLELEAAQ